MTRHTWAFLTLAIPLTNIASAFAEPSLPDRAPQDNVMAPAAEVERVAAWACAAFTGQPAPGAANAVSIDLIRQDHGTLQYGRSCLGTPLKIGSQSYATGLGTHANSEIRVHLPAGARRFQAAIGIDNNYDTAGQRGSVQFSVEIAGKEVFHSPTVKGGQEPLPVDVAIPANTTELTLKVDTTPDGAGWDQSDWADAKLVLDNKATIALDTARPAFLESQVPFSFRYGNANSADLLKTWKQTHEAKEESDRTRRRVTWTDPQTKLVVTAEVSTFKDYPGVDWVLTFENTGAKDTPILADIRALDAQLRTGSDKQPVVVHQIKGDFCNADSFLPFDTTLVPNQPLNMTPSGGRSSNGTFPFYNVQYADEGLITAIGWSGQWSSTLTRAPAGPTRIQAGMEKTHLLLHPGEKIRSPRILVMPWRGDRTAAHQRFRRLLMFHYAPKADGKPLQLPIAAQCFDRYVGSRPTWGTVAEQIKVATAAAKAGCDYHWLDAAWFDKGFPNGVGNWNPRKEGFPDGMKPLADAVHKLGLKFIVWFEPERVGSDTQTAREHPEYCFGGKDGGLYKLSDPKALRFMTDWLLKDVKDFGLDCYRNDFNMDPLASWQAADTPDRVGMTEIRYIEGLYAMWDELLAKNPGLWIDNCSSGGRRIDLELCSRSIPLWHSDTCCSPNHADWNQTHAAGLLQYIPLFTASAWEPTAYDARSATTGGLICQFALLDDNFSFATARAAIAETKAIQPFWYGDYYPVIAPTGTDTTGWIVHQFHRADLDAGVILAFRRSTSAYSGATIAVNAVKPDHTYTVEFSDEARQTTKKTMTGKDLAKELDLHIPTKPGSLLIRYSAAKP